jgi:hypothetical protein
LVPSAGDLRNGIAIRDLNEAIRLNPKYGPAFKNRAWLWSTCPNGKYCDGKRAVEASRTASKRAGWKEADKLDTLAVAILDYVSK